MIVLERQRLKWAGGCADLGNEYSRYAVHSTISTSRHSSSNLPLSWHQYGELKLAGIQELR